MSKYDKLLCGGEVMNKRPKRHPYRPWLPAPSDRDYPDSKYPGAPLVVPLRTFLNDKSMRCYVENVCCDCGSVHLHVYEVFKDQPKNQWWLVKRAIGLSIASELERDKHKYDYRSKKK